MDIVTRLRPSQWTPQDEPGPDRLPPLQVVIVIAALLTSACWLSIVAAGQFAQLPRWLQPNFAGDSVTDDPPFAVSTLLLVSTLLVAVVSVLAAETATAWRARLMLVFSGILSGSVALIHLDAAIRTLQFEQIVAAGQQWQSRLGVTWAWTLLAVAICVALGPRRGDLRLRLALAALPVGWVLLRSFTSDDPYGQALSDSSFYLLKLLPAGVAVFLCWQAMGAGRVAAWMADLPRTWHWTGMRALALLVAAKLLWVVAGLADMLPADLGGRIDFRERLLGDPRAYVAATVALVLPLAVLAVAVWRGRHPDGPSRSRLLTGSLWLVTAVLALPTLCAVGREVLSTAGISLHLDNAGYAASAAGALTLPGLLFAATRTRRWAAWAMLAAAGWLAVQAFVVVAVSDYPARADLPRVVIENQDRSGRAWEHLSGIDPITIFGPVSAALAGIHDGALLLLFLVAAGLVTVALLAICDELLHEAGPSTHARLALVVWLPLTGYAGLALAGTEPARLLTGSVSELPLHELQLFDVALHSKADLVATALLALALITRRVPPRGTTVLVGLLMLSTILAYPKALVPAAFTSGLPLVLVLLLPFGLELARLPRAAMRTSGITVLAVRQLALGTVLGTAAYSSDLGAPLGLFRRDPDQDRIFGIFEALGADPPFALSTLLPLLIVIPTAYLAFAQDALVRGETRRLRRWTRDVDTLPPLEDATAGVVPEHWGDERSANLHVSADGTSAVHVLRIDAPDRVLLSTLGLSAWPNAFGDRDVRIELCGLASREHAPSFATCLAHAALSVQQAVSAAPGVIFRDALTHADLPRTLPHLVWCEAPWPDLARAEVLGAPVGWLLALPLSDPEAAALERVGPEAFWSAVRVDPYDLDREPTPPAVLEQLVEGVQAERWDLRVRPAPDQVRLETQGAHARDDVRRDRAGRGRDDASGDLGAARADRLDQRTEQRRADGRAAEEHQGVRDHHPPADVRGTAELDDDLGDRGEGQDGDPGRHQQQGQQAQGRRERDADFQQPEVQDRGEQVALPGRPGPAGGGQRPAERPDGNVLDLGAADLPGRTQIDGAHTGPPGEHAVGHEDTAGADPGHSRAGGSRASDAGGVETGAVEADGVQTAVRSEHLQEQRLPRRHVGDGREPESEGRAAQVEDGDQ